MSRKKYITKVVILNKIKGIRKKRGRTKTMLTVCIEGHLKRLEMINWRRIALKEMTGGSC